MIIFIFMFILTCSGKEEVRREFELPPEGGKHCFIKGEGWEIMISSDLLVYNKEEGLYGVYFDKEKEYIRIHEAIQPYWDGIADLSLSKIERKKIKPLVKVNDIIMQINDCSFDIMFPSKEKGMTSSWPYNEAGYMSLFHALLFYDESKAKEYIKTVKLIRNGKVMTIKTNK